MPEPMSCCRAAGSYCERCDLLVGLDGLRVIGVGRDEHGALTVTVESAPQVVGCRCVGCLPTVTTAGRCGWSMPRRRADQSPSCG